jgi:hypothetical protein
VLNRGYRQRNIGQFCIVHLTIYHRFWLKAIAAASTIVGHSPSLSPAQ